MAEVAMEFSTESYYSAGDLVIYGGVLYQFTESKSAGAWDPEKVKTFDQNPEIIVSEILAASDNAEKAILFYQSIVLSPQQIEGTRYKYIWTNAPDPRK